MSKPRSDSAWRRLTPEQRETLEGWLFEESLGYREVLDRAQKEFGVTASIPSLAGYYQRLARERKFNHFTEAQNWAVGTADTPHIPKVLNYALQNLIGVTVYEMAVEGPDKVKVKEISQLMKLLLQSRQQAVREARLALKKERLQMDQHNSATRELRHYTKAEDERAKHESMKCNLDDMRAALKFIKTEVMDPPIPKPPT